MAIPTTVICYVCSGCRNLTRSLYAINQATLSHTPKHKPGTSHSKKKRPSATQSANSNSSSPDQAGSTAGTDIEKSATWIGATSTGKHAASTATDSTQCWETSINTHSAATPHSTESAGDQTTPTTSQSPANQLSVQPRCLQSLSPSCRQHVRQAEPNAKK